MSHLPVLIVDDEPQIRSLVSHILSRQGFQVVEAANGRAALSTLHTLSGAVGLVISDITMPGLGGAALSRRIKESFPKIPVLLLSANPGPDDLAAGDAFLWKPFTQSALLREIGKLMEQPQCA